MSEATAVFHLPVSHRKRLRMIKCLEPPNKEIKRRTQVATMFPKKASLLRLVTALDSTISEKWETGKIHLNTETE